MSIKDQEAKLAAHSLWLASVLRGEGTVEAIVAEAVQRAIGEASKDLVAALKKAVQLATVASDWDLQDVEIDGESVDIYDLREEFTTALRTFGIEVSS